MRLPEAALLLVASAGLSGCIVSWSSQPTPAWTTGFWFWEGSSIDPAYSGQELDVLFVQVGTIRKETSPAYVRSHANATEQWYANGTLPSQLPPAREYWLVYRYANQGVPDLQVASEIATQISRLHADARERHLNVAGLQLDIDSPTSKLPEYADFMRDVRKGLPKGLQVSITALLDWFRSGTAVGDVIAQADEFVPQFYDLGDPAADGQAAIAARIDAARWVLCSTASTSDSGLVFPALAAPASSRSSHPCNAHTADSSSMGTFDPLMSQRTPLLSCTRRATQRTRRCSAIEPAERSKSATNASTLAIQSSSSSPRRMRSAPR